MKTNEITPRKYVSKMIRVFEATRRSADPAMWQEGVGLLETYLSTSLGLGRIPIETARDLRQRIYDLRGEQ